MMKFVFFILFLIPCVLSSEYTRLARTNTWKNAINFPLCAAQRERPPWKLIWDSYPGVNSNKVRDFLGFPHAYSNTCAIRMSWTLRAAGMPICLTPKFYYQAAQRIGSANPNWAPGGVQRSRRDGFYYMIRVAMLKPYLTLLWGKPHVLKSHGRWTAGNNWRNDIAKRKGIIVFQTCGWSDATGHFDLWNGRRCRNNHPSCNEYLEKDCNDIAIWDLPYRNPKFKPVWINQGGIDCSGGVKGKCLHKTKERCSTRVVYNKCPSLGGNIRCCVGATRSPLYATYMANVNAALRREGKGGFHGLFNKAGEAITLGGAAQSGGAAQGGAAQAQQTNNIVKTPPPAPTPCNTNKCGGFNLCVGNRCNLPTNSGWFKKHGNWFKLFRSGPYKGRGYIYNTATKKYEYYWVAKQGVYSYDKKRWTGKGVKL